MSTVRWLARFSNEHCKPLRINTIRAYSAACEVGSNRSRRAIDLHPIIGTFIDVENRRREVERTIFARAIHLTLRHAERVQMFEQLLQSTRNANAAIVAQQSLHCVHHNVCDFRQR